ncbi:DUF1643 domain-containing protein [Streptomyces sp. NPDC101112]|uniref:DUF1643 domain-containing protein n=1 Tax=Streptomyces sp. NPDC101112 TaxID=3366105 RepID=UPI00380BCC65
MTRRQGLQMKGGVQLPMFAVEVEPEPATAAGPARPAAAEWAEANGLQLQTGSAGSAVLSPCGTYRYRLDRVWDEQAPPLVWVMLNPSTADADEDDATLRRCTTFSKKAGHGGLTVVNLFALRSKDPGQLRKHADPIGPRNEAALLDATASADRVAVAWGDVGRAERAEQARAVTALLTGHGRPLECLGLTGKGHPRHPLYVRDETQLTAYAPQSPIGDRRPAAATTVVDMHGHRDDPEFEDVVYVGRRMTQGGWNLQAHPLANPYRVGEHGDAAEVVERYGVWLDENPELVARELSKLRGKRLGCWCAEGQPCHARVLAARADQEVKA